MALLPDPPDHRRTAFAEATHALRETLVAFAGEPETEAMLPALWAYAAAARRHGIPMREMAARFRIVYDAAYAPQRADPGASTRRREELVDLLIGSALRAPGYLRAE